MGAQQGKERGSHSSGGGGGGGGGHGGSTVSCIGVSSSSPVASGSPHCISGGSSSGGGGLSAGSTLRGSRMKSHQSAGHGSSGISIGSSGSSRGGGGSSASHKDNRCNPTVGLNIFTEHNGKYAPVCNCVSVCVLVSASVYISHPQHTNALTVCIHPHTHNRGIRTSITCICT